MKNIKLIIAVALLGIVFSCNDDILNNSGIAGDSQQTASFTSKQGEDAATTNDQVPAGFVNGIYGQMIQTGSGGSSSQEDFGHKGYDIYSDLLSGDMAYSVLTYGWYSRIINFLAPTDFTQGENRRVWRYYYRIVRSANNVIKNLGGNDAVPELQGNKYAMGQAKAMRAHSYFYLTQFFEKEYNANEPILPLYLEPILENKAKATASEIYDQMEKDLTDAISLLEGFNRTAKNQVNKDVAQVIYAYVLGARGTNFPKMASLTQNVINAGNNTILSKGDVTNGFADVNNASWMWGIDITTTNGLGLVSWWGQIDAYSYSYGWAGDFKAMDKSLFDKISADDARKAQFFGKETSSRYLQPLKKFYASNKIGGISQTVTADYVYMRIEEAYLLNAEANARANNDAAARISLKALMSNRIPDVSYIDGLSGQNLIDEIYLQTRIELWGEGKSYLALKRNKATMTRGTNHLSLVGTPIPYNDERLTFEIPQDEIQNNPFITEQNK
ncbi:RagB/SusD family nutrient uptake outer membrane protein [Polaribacter cellanae]|uniref:RagB/SusD family nutrient uptake outer membrane protein n=1 Tax=Polaribacter cellanae TaxID=2818493 RepID=A0A975CQR2_9FLAO|nr:RagB/SusD family nutrient uptake outer membrane protein [Polaribacter cellanae]QTE23978.1 RagB/SusD family nutrient uptake outer membrane protein [Polaribacter cellanae]